MHLGLRHVALNVRALDVMKRFYVDVLGYTIEWEPDADNVYLSSGADNLALHRTPGEPGLDLGRSGEQPAGSLVEGSSAPIGGSSGALDHLGLFVATPGDVDAWAAYLESRGIALDARPRTHRDGARSLYIKDPEGNRIQIIHHQPIRAGGAENDA